MTNYTHQPVLLDQVLEVLNPKKGEAYLDCTAGFGGHAAPILDAIGTSGRAVLVDRDPAAIKHLREVFSSQVELIHNNFADAAKELVEDGSLFNMILLDLGVSSPQLENPARGFSFNLDGPLDMRMDSSGAISAATLVNTYSQAQLEQVIRDYGEERHAKRVAAAIVSGRPYATTKELAKAVRSATSAKGIDSATRTFQALRIEVNEELVSLKEALPALTKLLTPNGRLAVISFHSLEDRIVKKFFEQESRDCICPPKQPVCTCSHVASLRLIIKKAIAGNIHDSNPRARSAKLRAAAKINSPAKTQAKTKGGEYDSIS